MIELKAGPSEEGERLYQIIKRYLGNAGNGFIYKMLRKKNITLNGKKATGAEAVSDGDVITLWLSAETIAKFRSDDFKTVPYDLDVVYEDKHVLIINKSRNKLSQKASPEDISINEEAISYMVKKGEITIEDLRTFRPSVCNRLDRNTTGLILFGKDMTGLHGLTAAIKDSGTIKIYYALVMGRLTGEDTLKGYLQKNTSHNRAEISSTEKENSKYIETEYKVVASTEEYSLLKIRLLTGRSHQIRAHMASIGHPVAGDGKYGDVRVNKELKSKYGIYSQALHAGMIEFGEISELPDISRKKIYCPMDGKLKNMITDIFGDLKWEHGIPEA